MRRSAAITLVAVGMSLAACSSGVEQSAQACDHFRSAMDDVAKDRLWDTALQEELAQIDTEAATAQTSVRRGAAQLVKSVTPLDNDSLTEAIGQMTAACEAAGR